MEGIEGDVLFDGIIILQLTCTNFFALEVFGAYLRKKIIEF